MRMVITIYRDPSHGWGKENKALLDKLGIADKISKYSYMREGKAYLEEDVDLNILLQALTKAGREFRLDDRYSERPSRIRGYDAYKYEEA